MSGQGESISLKRRCNCKGTFLIKCEVWPRCMALCYWDCIPSACRSKTEMKGKQEWKKFPQIRRERCSTVLMPVSPNEKGTDGMRRTKKHVWFNNFHSHHFQWLFRDLAKQKKKKEGGRRRSVPCGALLCLCLLFVSVDVKMEGIAQGLFLYSLRQYMVILCSKYLECWILNNYP